MSEIRPCPPFEPSHLQGEMDISYAELVDVFGPPNSVGDEHKIDAYWRIVINDVYCTIYNYKTGKNYLGKRGLAVELIRDWHIGGQSEDAVRAVLAAIEQERHSQSQKTGKDARSNEQEG
jgi:hypothetical protein